MKYFVGITLVAIAFVLVLGKVFGIFQTSTAVDFLIAMALTLSWFSFIIVKVKKTPGVKALSDEYDHQEHQYMLMM